MTAYTVRGISVRRGAARLLDDVSVEVRFGELLALVGPNGAGKSTLLSVLAGDIAADAGEVLCAGRPLAAWRPRERARWRAVLTQHNTLAFTFTAQQVVELGRAPWPADSEQDAVAVEQAMHQADVLHLAHRVFPSLSGGERARVSLARVLAQQTDVVLLDEPTAALDIAHQEQVLSVARGLAASGRAVVVVVHDLSLAAAYADRVVMLRRGRVVADGAPGAVFTAERVEAVYGTAVRVIPDPGTGRPVVLPRR